MHTCKTKKLYDSEKGKDIYIAIYVHSSYYFFHWNIQLNANIIFALGFKFIHNVLYFCLFSLLIWWNSLQMKIYPWKVS